MMLKKREGEICSRWNSGLIIVLICDVLLEQLTSLIPIVGVECEYGIDPGEVASVDSPEKRSFLSKTKLNFY